MGYYDEEADIVLAAIGKKIVSVALKDDALEFVMEDGYAFIIADDGQACCEHRYFSCSDDLSSFADAYLMGVEEKEAPDIDDGGEVHEVQFLHVQTSKGAFCVESHNEHNGYYGGFLLSAKLVTPKMKGKRY